MKITEKNSLPITSQTNGLKGARDRVSISSKEERVAGKNVGENVKVSLSGTGNAMQVARQIALNTPDVRSDRVEHLKSLIKSGNYNVDSASIADKMVEEALMEL